MRSEGSKPELTVSGASALQLRGAPGARARAGQRLRQHLQRWRRPVLGPRQVHSSASPKALSSSRIASKCCETSAVPLKLQSPD